MPLAFILLFVTLIGGALFVVKRAYGSEQGDKNMIESPTLRALYIKHGDANGIDADLLQAVGIVESSLNPDAVRWNPPRDVSVGVQQILCVPPEGTKQGEDYLAQNLFNVSPWPVTFNALKNPDLNISIGAQILGWNLRTFGYPRGVAVYNRWASRVEPLNGPFTNQDYVNKVIHHLTALKG